MVCTVSQFPVNSTVNLFFPPFYSLNLLQFRVLQKSIVFISSNHCGQTLCMMEEPLEWNLVTLINLLVIWNNPAGWRTCECFVP